MKNPILRRKQDSELWDLFRFSIKSKNKQTIIFWKDFEDFGTKFFDKFNLKCFEVLPQNC